MAVVKPLLALTNQPTCPFTITTHFNTAFITSFAFKHHAQKVNNNDTHMNSHRYSSITAYALPIAAISNWVSNAFRITISVSFAHNWKSVFSQKIIHYPWRIKKRRLTHIRCSTSNQHSEKCKGNDEHDEERTHFWVVWKWNSGVKCEWNESLV